MTTDSLDPMKGRREIGSNVVDFINYAEITSMMIGETVQLLEEAVTYTGRVENSYETDEKTIEDCSIELLQFNAMLTRLGSWLLTCSGCKRGDKLPALKEFGVHSCHIFMGLEVEEPLVVMAGRLNRLIDRAYRIEHAANTRPSRTHRRRLRGRPLLTVIDSSRQ